MTEVQRLVWLMSRPTCLEINHAMQEFSSVSFVTSDQHKEACAARIHRDQRDTQKLPTFLTERDPFSNNPTLRNITTGVTAQDNVNANEVQSVGMAMINSIAGKNVKDHTFKKRDQLVTMRSNNFIKIHGDFVHINPQLLFQRLVTAGTRNEQLPEIFL